MNDAKKPSPKVKERIVQIRLSKTEVIKVRIRLGGTDVQVPPAPPVPRPKAQYLLDVGRRKVLGIDVGIETLKLPG